MSKPKTIPTRADETIILEPFEVTGDTQESGNLAPGWYVETRKLHGPFDTKAKASDY